MRHSRAGDEESVVVTGHKQKCMDAMRINHRRDVTRSACASSISGNSGVGAKPSSAGASAAWASAARLVEIELIKTLLRIAVEHAGAERGLLILFPTDEPRIAAEATTGRGQVEVTLRQTAMSPAELQSQLIHLIQELSGRTLRVGRSRRTDGLA
jgi:hypothetical protein